MHPRVTMLYGAHELPKREDAQGVLVQAAVRLRSGAIL